MHGAPWVTSTPTITCGSSAYERGLAAGDRAGRGIRGAVTRTVAVVQGADESQRAQEPATGLSGSESVESWLDVGRHGRRRVAVAAQPPHEPHDEDDRQRDLDRH